MNTNIIVTIYCPKSQPDNPLVQIPLLTTDDQLAEANYNALVAHECAENGWRVAGRFGNQVALTNADGDSLVIRHHFNTEPFAMTLGRSQW